MVQRIEWVGEVRCRHLRPSLDRLLFFRSAKAGNYIIPSYLDLFSQDGENGNVGMLLVVGSTRADSYTSLYGMPKMEN